MGYTGICEVDCVLDILLNRNLLITFFLSSLVYFIWRQPRPRKGAGNKAVFITGCDSGMGFRIARRLDEMESVVFAGCLSPDGLGAKSLRDSCSNRLHIVPLDITDEKQVVDAVEYVKKNLPAEEDGLYCLLNNAGIFSQVNFQLMTSDMCRQVVDVNLTGTVRVTKHFLPLLKKVPGRIVTITSVMARLTYPNIAIYTATKHALNAFFASLRSDLKETGIRIATIEPGDFTRTTDIYRWTRQNLDEMWANVSQEDKEDMSPLFEEAKNSAAKKKLPPNEQEANYRMLLEDVEDAMFAEGPYDRYVTVPLKQKIVLSVLRNLPDTWQQYLMYKAMERETH